MVSLSPYLVPCKYLGEQIISHSLFFTASGYYKFYVYTNIVTRDTRLRKLFSYKQRSMFTEEAIQRAAARSAVQPQNYRVRLRIILRLRKPKSRGKHNEIFQIWNTQTDGQIEPITIARVPLSGGSFWSFFKLKCMWQLPGVTFLTGTTTKIWQLLSQPHWKGGFSMCWH